MIETSQKFEGDEAESSHEITPVSLSRGLFRNTIFNVAGWILPAFLTFITIPYIVSGLGSEVYGIFGVVSIVAGYISVLQVPVASANVRFVAEAYGRQDWDEMRGIAFLSLMFMGFLGGVGALIIFLAADVLAKQVFEVPAPLIETALLALKISALNYFFNGLMGTLRGIPTAFRRFGAINIATVLVEGLRMISIVLAVWLGFGLLGAVTAQLLSSLIAVISFGWIAWATIRKFPGKTRILKRRNPVIRRLLSFSGYFFLGDVGGRFASQIDRTIVGILLGTTALTFYDVPTKIIDKLWALMTTISGTLYPLSAEALASDNMQELRDLYVDATKMIRWLFYFIATVLVLTSKEFLTLWMGTEFAAASWLVFVFLAVASMWHASSRVAHYVCSGLGRADVSMWLGWGGLISTTIPVLLLTQQMGLNGAALGFAIGMLPTNVFYDIYVQRQLLGQKNWWLTVALYGKPLLTSLFLVGILWNLSVSGLWGNLIIKSILGIVGFLLGMFVFDRPLLAKLIISIKHRIYPMKNFLGR